jgi:hypothetical protein
VGQRVAVVAGLPATSPGPISGRPTRRVVPSSRSRPDRPGRFRHATMPLRDGSPLPHRVVGRALLTDPVEGLP